MMEVGDKNTWFTECLHTNNKPQILRLTIRKIFIYRKVVTPHAYTNIKNVLSFREARNQGMKILTAQHSDSE
jgi:hypothetical protein